MVGYNQPKMVICSMGHFMGCFVKIFFGYIKPIIYVDLWGYDGTCGCLESGAPKLLAALDMMFRSVLAGILCQTFVPEIYG